MVVLGLKHVEELETKKENCQKGLSTYQKSFCYFQLIDKNTQEIIGEKQVLKFKKKAAEAGDCE